MTTYTAKPHQVEAFHFTDPKQKAPGWLRTAHQTGQLWIHLGADPHIIVYRDKQKEEVQRARLNDWVLYGPNAEITVMSDDEFRAKYKRHLWEKGDDN